MADSSSNSKSSLGTIHKIVADRGFGFIKVPGEKDLGSCVYLVFNPKYKFGDIKFDAGCIAHESLHATSFIFMIAGIVPDVNNDEPQAYLLDFIVTEVTEFLKPYMNQS